MGTDHTILATVEGQVTFKKGLKGRTFISVLPVAEERASRTFTFGVEDRPKGRSPFPFPESVRRTADCHATTLKGPTFGRLNGYPAIPTCASEEGYTRKSTARPDRDRTLRPATRAFDAGLSALDVCTGAWPATQGIPHPSHLGAAEAFCARAMAAGAEEEIWVMDGTHVGAARGAGVISLQEDGSQPVQVAFRVAPAFVRHAVSEAVNALVAANPQKNCTMFAEAAQ